MGYITELRKLVGHRPLILPGAVVMIFNRKDELLLQLRSDGGWGLPGGLMELGESLEETARREVKEETGLTVGELTLEGVFSGAEYYLKVANGDELYSVTTVFSTNDYQGSLEVDECESLDLKFFSLELLPKNLQPSYMKYIKPYLHKKGLDS
ncbi:NUDIX domain-containing protein [Mesobacillus boroniphilus]|uniref:NUDIX domain-containing protein n=1 Tax=Mesobacillus boroniphilus TaxID=308892 RepID=A0A944GX71_9BACI|nr:NUDIX hydrolase [Mesobacillus boroniphilus]MBS8264385.1 NUDIX domain-containing protein [Mesobacillus boroniphilus]